jgi:hypothetical protein
MRHMDCKTAPKARGPAAREERRALAGGIGLAMKFSEIARWNARAGYALCAVALGAAAY